MPTMLPHTKRPRDGDSSADDAKENVVGGGTSALPPAVKKPPTVPRPFRAARGVAASHRQDGPKSTLPASLQHTPISSTRTSGSSTEKSGMAARRGPYGMARRPPGASSRVGFTPSHRDHAGASTAPAGQPVAENARPHTCAEPPTELEETWRVKREALEATVHDMEMTDNELQDAIRSMHDVIESMLFEHEAVLHGVQESMAADTTAHEAALKALEAREDCCRALKSRALEEVETLQQRVAELKSEKERVQELTVLEHEKIAVTRQRLANAQDEIAAAHTVLAEHLSQEERMADASYGLSGEVKDMVVEMEKLQKERQGYSISGMELEVRRRELYSKCEELKGSIRVYCRVKGSSLPSEPVKTSPGSEPASSCSTDASANNAQNEETEDSENNGGELNREDDDDEKATTGNVDDDLRGREASPASSVATTLTCASTGRGPSSSQSGAPSGRALVPSCRVPTASGGASGRMGNGSSRVAATATATAADDADDAIEPIYTFQGTAEDFGADPATAVAAPPTAATTTAAGCESVPPPPAAATTLAPASLHRTVHVHSMRANATSTGRQTSSESFTFDRVFDGTAAQADVYHEIEPLVHSAVDGYAVCVFAYGQTGSGKTYTMEGSLERPERCGVIPRALQTIFSRQEALAQEGWKYDLSCYFVEIYNDSIRDLFQNPSVYASGGAGFGNTHYHTVKHGDDRTSITNVRERPIHSIAEFRKMHRQAVQNRRTAKTQLNERSSRSHSIFTLHITGINATIGQRSEGVLCLVDLAGSERVSDSGAQGQQFKEAVSINRSLLDLGKCISAMRSGGSAVAPWRNSKLTYLLQRYLGAKGGKMLMLVNVSNERRHLPESLNALRFATRVSETVVGTSVKRVTNL